MRKNTICLGASVLIVNETCQLFCVTPYRHLKQKQTSAKNKCNEFYALGNIFLKVFFFLISISTLKTIDSGRLRSVSIHVFFLSIHSNPNDESESMALDLLKHNGFDARNQGVNNLWLANTSSSLESI